MKKERIDQILIRLGYATEKQIIEALKKQKGLGGRLGTHLIYSGTVTEEQLAEALSIQHQVPAFQPGRHLLTRELLDRFPIAFIRKHLVLPAALDTGSSVLSLVVVDPRDLTAISESMRLIRCAGVSLFVTPEVTFEKTLETYGLNDDRLSGPQRLIELPELFEGDGDADHLSLAALDEAVAREATGPRVLLITDRAFLRHFLVPLFEREGLQMITTSDAREAAEQLSRRDCEHVLVSAEMASGYRNWIRQGVLPLPRVPVTELDGISRTLMGATAPYHGMFQSLVHSLRLLAENQGASAASAPAYDLLRKDVRALGRAVELNRLAVDGLEVAMLLVVAAAESVTDDGTGIDWPRTIEHAAAVRFPWNVEGALGALRVLLTERVNLDEFCRHDPEIALGGQVLALVWHNHQRAGHHLAGAGNRTLLIKSEMRQKCGRLARSEVIERYLSLIERSGEDLRATATHQLFVVGRPERALQQFATRLGHLGYQPVSLEDLDEAVAMCVRQAPTAVFIHDASFPDAILSVRERFATGERLLVYAVTTRNEPSQILNLFDAGFDDVFSLPADIDIVAARLRKSIRDGSATPVATTRPGCFQAAFTAFAFTDLLQTLSQSFKSVRIELSRGDQERAVIHLDRGQLIHAACGSLSGPEAVHRIVAWEDDGEFSVEPAVEFPEPNIAVPLESILMEGCRLLDESRIQPLRA